MSVLQRKPLPTDLSAAPLVLLTVDVEEDMPGWRITDPVRVENVRGLQAVAEVCREVGVRPTFLCTYPVVTTPSSVALLRGLLEHGDCEIGSHLHAWNTPPFRGVPGRDVDERKVAYYEYELDHAGLAAKLDTLHTAVTALAETEPVSFRSGRFGLNGRSLEELDRLRYQVDTSVTPLVDHSSEGGGPDFRRAPQFPYHPSLTNVCRPGTSPILEVPVSIGLTRPLPARLQRAYAHIPASTRVRGLLSRDYLRVLDFAWLYPARFELELMRRAARALVHQGAPVLNIFCHSSEFSPATSAYVKTQADVDDCLHRLRAILEFCVGELSGVPVTLAESAGPLTRWLPGPASRT